MEESLAEFYFRQLEESTNSVHVLVNFYKALFGFEEVDSSIYSIFGRLVRIYGEKGVYFSLLDSSSMENIDHSNIVRLLSYFAKKRLEERFVSRKVTDLTTFSKKNIEEMERKRKLRFPKVLNE